MNSQTLNEYFGDKDITKHNTAVMRTINAYMHQNINALSTPLYELITFGSIWKKRFLIAYGIDEKDFKEFVKKSEVLDSSWNTVTDPINMALYMSYVHTNKSEFLNFIGVKMLTSTMFKYYNKNGGLNPSIMRYIVEGVDAKGKPVMSERYLLKQKGSTMAMCIAIMQTVEHDFIKGKYRGKDLRDDKIAIEIINSISARMNLTMRRIRSLYELNKDSRMWQEADMTNAEMSISNETESVKVNTLLASVSSSILSGMNVELLKQVHGTKYFKKINMMYNDDTQKIIDYCNYIISFYTTKKGQVTFASMKRDFYSVVVKGKGRDDSIIESLKAKYIIRDRNFNKIFIQMHALLIYRIIIRL